MVDYLNVNLTSLWIAKRLTDGSMDKCTSVHVANLCTGNLHAHLRGLFLHEGLVDKILPHLIANLHLQLGRYLSCTLLHLVVVLHLGDQFVKLPRGHGLAVNNTHVRYASAVLGKVAKNERQNGHTDNCHSHPRMFSNTSNDSHFL